MAGFGTESCHPVRTRSDGHGPVFSAAPQSSVPALEDIVVFGLEQLHYVPLRYTKQASSWLSSQVQVITNFHVLEVNCS